MNDRLTELGTARSLCMNTLLFLLSSGTEYLTRSWERSHLRQCIHSLYHQILPCYLGNTHLSVQSTSRYVSRRKTSINSDGVVPPPIWERCVGEIEAKYHDRLHELGTAVKANS